MRRAPPKNPPPNPRVIAIVQARMGSTRLPGKVLREIAGRPLLWHVVQRLRRCETLNSIAIATSEADADNAIADFCRDENITCVRGPEDNVLERFALASARTKAGIIVRVSSDAPFIDPGFIDRLVNHLIEQDGDYVIADPASPCAHEGVDPFSRRALDKLLDEAANDPVAREHVSGYFKLHPEFVRIVHVPAPEFARAPVRLTIDTPDDLKFIETLYARLSAKAGEASLADLLELLKREPAIRNVNAHVRQKTLGGPGGLALIRCDGGGPLGFGHVRRTLSLARALRDIEGIGVHVALNGDAKAAALIANAGFEITRLPNSGQEQALEQLAATRRPDLFIADARENLGPGTVANLARQTGIAALIDDASERRLAATHAYYPPMPEAEKLSWDGAQTQIRIGWEWAVLGLDPARYEKNAAPNSRPRLVVSMGGSDPFALTRIAAKALAGVNIPFEARFIVGPGFANPSGLAGEIEAAAPHFRAVQDAADLGTEFAAADLALIAFGVTAYELAALGVPALYLAISEAHTLSASAFEYAGMGVLLGLGPGIGEAQIAKPVWNLLRDPERRHEMRTAGLSRLDGKGAERVAADLAAALRAKRESSRISA